MSPEEIIKTVWGENPTLADTPKNGELVGQFLKENGQALSVDNVRIAVKILGYPFDKLDRQKPPVPTPPPPQPVVESAEPEEVLENWQIPLNPPPSEWQIRRASKEAVKDYLKRAKAQSK